jgi:hypothetical protein
MKQDNEKNNTPAYLAWLCFLAGLKGLELPAEVMDCDIDTESKIQTLKNIINGPRKHD